MDYNALQARFTRREVLVKDLYQREDSIRVQKENLARAEQQAQAVRDLIADVEAEIAGLVKED